jgi:hypothetical protein
MSHSSRNGTGKRRATGIAQNRTIFIVQTLGSVHTALHMTLNELKKILLMKGLDLGTFHGSCGNLVARLRNRRTQTKNISCLGNLYEQTFALA